MSGRMIVIKRMMSCSIPFPLSTRDSWKTEVPPEILCPGQEDITQKWAFSHSLASLVEELASPSQTVLGKD
ncbi:hypothetical protein Tco_0506785 [Tanacetum coccineum]